MGRSSSVFGPNYPDLRNFVPNVDGIKMLFILFSMCKWVFYVIYDVCLGRSTALWFHIQVSPGIVLGGLLPWYVTNNSMELINPCEHHVMPKNILGAPW